MMTYKIIIYKFLFLLCIMYALTACIDDDIVGDCSPELTEGIFGDGYSLNVVITLDDMGGTGITRAATDEELIKWENHIDPERLRVLFFNSKDEFLFESKSRWVKKLDYNDPSRWLVSIPVFTYGNDVYENEVEKEWNWTKIRKELTTADFKIAILANRPEREWYPGFKNTAFPDGQTAGWIDNTGPHWTPKDSWKKDVFDLHHAQYDKIYHAKSDKEDFYDFIMDETDPEYPKMGATSSWVAWLDNNNDIEWKNNDAYLKYFVLPSENHPIPMYGIQKFNQIVGWQEGTPFNLSGYIPGGNDINEGYAKKTISLLRSVTKLELLIPTSIPKPDFVSLAYPNVYARCEPMDVWTPTDELWDGQHKKGDCEITSIMNYGPVSRAGDPLSNSKEDFQKRISWFYGIWKKNNKWDFKGENFKTEDIKPETDKTPYPRIFNSCVQRSTMVLCSEDSYSEYYNYKDNKNYHRYVVYVGERNVNDPSELGKLGNSDSGKPTIMYWMFNNKETKKLYGLPITDYTKLTNPIHKIKPEEYTFAKGKEKLNHKDINATYMQDVMKIDPEKDADILPWPLIRNHIYRLTLDFQPIILSWDTEKFNSLEDWKITFKNVDPNNPDDIYTIEKTQTDGVNNLKSGKGQGITLSNGSSYTAIKTSANVQNKLTLPQGKVTKRITLYSYVNANPPVNYTSLIDFNGSEESPNKNGITANNAPEEMESDGYNVYRLKNGYTSSSNAGTNIQLNTDGGFKKGDIITIAGFINNGGAGKRGTVVLFTANSYNSTSTTTINTFSDFANFANGEQMTEQSYTLTKDYNVLYLGRDGTTNTNVAVIKVQRPGSRINGPVDTYWKEVAGNDTYTLAETGMSVYNDRNGYDAFTFDFPATNTVTFTNTGSQVCYVIAVEVEDGSNPSSSRSAENRKTIEFTVKSEDLHSESLKLD